MKICISTCKGYSESTIPNLLNSLRYANFNINDVVIVEGNNEKTELTTFHGAVLWKVEHNSFDITALLGICELELKSDKWFLLHDTCAVGNTFTEKVYSYSALMGDANCIPLKYYPSMSIGIYKHDYIIDNYNILQKYKSFTKTADDIKSAKCRAFESEDCLLWRLTQSETVISVTRNETTPDKKIWNFNYSSGRIQEYFPELDLYKLKANYCGGMINTEL